MLRLTFASSREQILTLRITGAFLGIFLGLFVVFVGVFMYMASIQQEDIFINHIADIRQSPATLDAFIARVQANPLVGANNKGGLGNLRFRGFNNVIVVLPQGVTIVRGPLDSVASSLLPIGIPENTVLKKDIEDWDVYMYRFHYGDADLYFYEDTSVFSPFQNTLIIDGLFMILFATIVLYTISYRFARMTIAPIEESVRRLAEYNRNISHELRTPLSVIQTNLQLARTRNAEKYIASSLEEVSTMEKIINTLLFLSEKGALVDKESVDLATIVTATESTVATLYRDRGVKFEMVGDTKAKVDANPDLLRSLLQNLIENAYKYATTGTTIKLSLSTTGIEVENHGRTLSPEEITHMFDPFYKGHGDNAPGFGLGLSIVRRIVELHAWRITFTSHANINKVHVSFS